MQHRSEGSPFGHASVVKAPSVGGQQEDNRLSSSRAYALALAPQLIYAQCSLIPALVSSGTHNQLEFQAVGSLFVVQPSPNGPRLARVPSAREDIFQDTTLDLRTKRSLMRFLRYVASYEKQDDWQQRKSLAFSQDLSDAFALPAASHGPLLALALGSDAAADTTMGVAVPRIARHVRSIGVFGPAFGAVLPKWGGLAEIAQVACRACAVGGGVYMLGNGIQAVSQASKEKLAVTLMDESKITTKWLIGGIDDIPTPARPPQTEFPMGSSTFKSISIVSSPLSSLFLPTSEGGVMPAGAIVVVQNGDASSAPVHILIHSGDTGECPSNQCILYASTVHPDGFDILDNAIDNFLRSIDEQTIPDVLWKMQFVHHLPDLSGSLYGSGCDQGNLIVFPSVSTDVVLEDNVMENIKIAWHKITGKGDEMFMKFEPRETVGVDDEEY